jgi:ribosomal protein S18 acetylase RimI-like enzyme
MLAKRNLKPIRSFGYFIKDEAGKIVAGCNGNILYGCLYVDTLWVDQALRGQGSGTKLMEAAESLGKESECNFMAVNTMDWEALDFYKNLGFYVELERRGFDKDSIFYFLRKDLK